MEAKKLPQSHSGEQFDQGFFEVSLRTLPTPFFVNVSNNLDAYILSCVDVNDNLDQACTTQNNTRAISTKNYLSRATCYHCCNVNATIAT